MIVDKYDKKTIEKKRNEISQELMNISTNIKNGIIKEMIGLDWIGWK